MIELTQNQIVDLFHEKLKATAGNCRTGTYNKADPTHFERGVTDFGIPYTIGANDELDGPEPENISVEWNDVTWGVEYTIAVPSIPEPVGGYWSREFGVDESHWVRCHERFFEVAKAILLHSCEVDFCDQPESHKIYR